MRALTASSVIALSLYGCGTSPTQDAHQDLVNRRPPSGVLLSHPYAHTFLIDSDARVASYAAADAVTKSDLSALDVDIQAEYKAVVNQCSTVLGNEATQNYASRNASLAIQIVGALAGSIVVPALAAGHAAAALIAGVGGVSGTANVLQNTVKSVGYDPESLYATREKLRQSVIDDTTKFLNGYPQLPQNAQAELAILDHMNATCAFVPISEPIAAPASPASAPAPASAPKQ